MKGEGISRASAFTSNTSPSPESPSAHRRADPSHRPHDAVLNVYANEERLSCGGAIVDADVEGVGKSPLAPLFQRGEMKV